MKKKYELLDKINFPSDLKKLPESRLQKVADELEMEDINYDLTFWNKYVDEIMSRVQKPEPRFAHGGLI